ncbi:MAG: hypothetical protein KBC46_03305 [Ferrovibrio sp.]|nr:hypothetical protein [Ferrovibrio sp.]
MESKLERRVSLLERQAGEHTLAAARNAVMAEVAIEVAAYLGILLGATSRPMQEALEKLPAMLLKARPEGPAKEMAATIMERLHLQWARPNPWRDK